MPNIFSKPKRGFTLIELMISVSIVAILFTIGVTTYRRSEVTGRDAKRKQDIQLISQALELYFQTNKRYPLTDSSNGYWQYSINTAPSGSSFWLGDTGSTSPVIPVIDFGQQYTSGLPTDPLNKSPYYYAYFAPPLDWSTKCLKTKYYVLYATLENKNDTDRYGAAPYSACGYSAAQLVWLNDTYAKIGGQY